MTSRPGEEPMNEDQVRAEALKMLDSHRQDATFYLAIVRQVVTLPVGQDWPTCHACGGTLCGACGACHLFDARLQGRPCPNYVADVERGLATSGGVALASCGSRKRH